MFNIIIYTYMIYVQDHLGTNVSTRVVFTCLGPTVRLGVRFNASTVAFVLNISDAGTVSINIYIIWVLSHLNVIFLKKDIHNVLKSSRAKELSRRQGPKGTP